MGLQTWINKLQGKQSQRQLVNPADILRTSFAAMFGPSEAGIPINEEIALRFSAVWSCVRILSELPASLPLEIIEEKGLSRIPVEFHPVKDILMYPNQYMNRFTYTELTNGYLQLWGNGISVIEYNKGIPIKLTPVHPLSVQPTMDNGKVFYKINDYLTGINGTFFSEEVVHHKMFSTNGIWGKSPIQVAKDNIGLGMAAEKFGNSFFRKGGNLKAVIETDNHLDDKVFADWKARWDKFYSGESGDHVTPILEYGLKYKMLGIPPEQAQFIATRQFQLQEIARIFNVPPHMIGDLSRTTFSNIEHSDIQFVKYTLRPILRRQELELEQKLLKPEELGRIRIRFNMDGLLRGDLTTITAHIHQMVIDGIITPNEGRTLLNRDPLPGLDTPYVPANITGKNPQDNNSQGKNIPATNDQVNEN
jgi:HK97 family phage portal protein